MTYGRYSFIVHGFRYGKCSCLLHLQMVGRKEVMAISLRLKPPCPKGIEKATSRNLVAFLLPIRTSFIALPIGIIYYAVRLVKYSFFSFHLFFVLNNAKRCRTQSGNRKGVSAWICLYLFFICPLMNIRHIPSQKSDITLRSMTKLFVNVTNCLPF